MIFLLIQQQLFQFGLKLVHKKKIGFTSNILLNKLKKFSFNIILFRFTLILCKGKEEIERTNNLISGSNNSLSPSISNPALYRRLAQTDSDTELISNTVNESNIQASLIETQKSVEELKQQAKVIY
jgi:hypothetical protein